MCFEDFEWNPQCSSGDYPKIAMFVRSSFVLARPRKLKLTTSDVYPELSLQGVKGPDGHRGQQCATHGLRLSALSTQLDSEFLPDTLMTTSPSNTGKPSFHLENKAAVSFQRMNQPSSTFTSQVQSGV